MSYSALRLRRGTYEITKAEVTSVDTGEKENIIALLSLGDTYELTQYYDNISQAELEAHQAAAAEAHQNGDPEYPEWLPSVFQPDTYYGSSEYPGWSLTEDGNFNAINFNIGVKFSF